MRLVFGLAAAALALSSCGSEKSGTFETDEGEGTYTVDSDSGDTTATFTTEDGTASFQSGSGVKPNLPDGWSVYPGADVNLATNIEGADGGGGALVTMASEDSVDDITAYYRKMAEDKGVKIEMELTTNGSKIIGGKGDDGTQFSLSVTPGADGEPNNAQLTVGKDLTR